MAGTLIIVGGHEDRKEKQLILREVARRVVGRKLVVTTVASREPDGTFDDYRAIFRGFGIECVNLEIRARGEALERENIDIINGTKSLFFTGGDQLKITSQIGDTPIFSRVTEIYQKGGLIAGTSAGASVVCETMLIGGPSEQSHRSDHELRMASGLGLLKNAIVDQHFAERGRFGRLLGAVARNPKNLGIGIDEDTAIIVEKGQSFYVLGSGAVYVLDGRNLRYSNIGEEEDYHALSVFGLTTHVLSQGDRFHLENREPEQGERADIEETVMSAAKKNGHGQRRTRKKG